MNYGLIAEKLAHSFSKEIHARLASYEYTLCELACDELDGFMKKRDFKAINVTIPYKEKVIPYLDFIDEGARAIGAVNTIVNRDGGLFGYNTDFYGMTKLFEHIGICVNQKKVVILGDGGTSKTAKAVCESLGAGEIIKVNRRQSETAITYDELYEKHTDAEILINTSPVGMYPNVFGCPVDIDKFDRLTGVVDAVYNPLRTPLVLLARERGIAAEGGLYMLVAQAVRASEIFTDTVYEPSVLDRVFSDIARQKEQIVLIGMPSSGKSTVGRAIADALGLELIDTDTLIANSEGMDIPSIFSTRGEEYFRKAEMRAVQSTVTMGACVIATGGGAVLNDENVRALRENGRLYFLDRPLEYLIPTDDRPLSSTREAIERRYNERYGRYCEVCDVRIDASGDVDSVKNLCIGDFTR